MSEETRPIDPDDAAVKPKKSATPKKPQEAVIYSAAAPAAVITINREEHGNAITPEIVAGLHAGLDLALDDDRIRAVIVTGAGSSFCSGLDLEYAGASLEQSYEEAQGEAEALARLLRRLRSYEKVTIAAVNGYALAIGCGIASVCDFTLATGGSKFGYPEVRSGFVPAVVSVYLRGMVSEKQLRDLLLTGRTLSAEDALAAGLISEVVPYGELIVRGKQIAEEIARNSPESIRMTKELLESLPGMEIDRALKAAVEYNARMRQSDDCKEGVRAFLERRSPRWAADADEPDDAPAAAASDSAGAPDAEPK